MKHLVTGVAVELGDGGFRDRDLYVFCATPDGNTVAHPTHVGTNLKQLKDKRGMPFGAEMFEVAAFCCSIEAATPDA